MASGLGAHLIALTKLPRGGAGRLTDSTTWMGLLYEAGGQGGQASKQDKVGPRIVRTGRVEWG